MLSESLNLWAEIIKDYTELININWLTEYKDLHCNTIKDQSQ